jgi:hypothetical protein
MAVTITFKSSIPVGVNTGALNKMGLCTVRGSIIPLSAGDDTANKALHLKYAKARKFEASLCAKCKAAAKGDLKAYRTHAKTYLSNKRCLLVALFDDNARRPLEDRKSLDELIALSLKYDLLKDLSEPARVWQQPKASGKGMRVICSFGPVARAAQQMFSKLLRLTYVPQPFQFPELTFSQKVQRAMKFIEEEGYAHALETDIKDFFPSFTEEALVAALPLPKEATRQIVLAKSAIWGPHPLYGHYGHISFPPGIPQGSASSAAVANWCIANMPLEKLTGSAVINHADNSLAFSVSPEAAEDAAKALSSGIAGLPGGNFHGRTEQAVAVKDGFRMLGCWVSISKAGHIEAEPTEANYKGFRTRAGRQRQRVYGRLTEAHMQDSKLLRIKGLQDFLRLESMVEGWVQAFAFCGPHINAVKDHYASDMKLLRHTFQITENELKPLKDRSTDIHVKWFSGS